MCQQGFHDALRYLQRNNRIACTRCIAVQSTYVINNDEEDELNKANESEEDEEFLFKNSRELSELNKNLRSFSSSFNNLVDLDFKIEEDDRIRNDELSDEEIDEELRKLVEFNNRMNNKRKNETLKEEFIQAMEQDFRHGTHQDCKNCQSRKENLYKENLPDSVNQAIQEACDKVNKGLINYIFKFRIMKIVSTLTVPYVLPFDITIALLNKLRKLLPLITSELSSSLRRVILFVISLVNTAKDKEMNNVSQHLANFNYKVALTEFNYTDCLNNNTSKETSARSRKISTSSNYSVDSIYETEKPKIQKSNSFKMRRTNSIEDIRHKLKKICSNENLAANNNCNFNAPNHTSSLSNTAAANNPLPQNYTTQDVKRLKRKSFAGNELCNLKNASERRLSVLDFLGCKAPERVLSKMSLNFSIDLNDLNNENLNNATDLNHNLNKNNISETVATDTDGQNAFCGSTSGAPSTSRPDTPIQFANNALNLGINDIEVQEQNIERFNSKLKELTTSKEALMAFHFQDDDNNVQVMEIFNVSDVESASSNDDEQSINDSENFDTYDDQAIVGSLNQETFDQIDSKRERKKSVFFR